MLKSTKVKKILLFSLPHLLYIAIFFNFYNYIYFPNGSAFEILYREIFLMSLIYFVLFTLLYFLLRRKLNQTKTFFTMVALVLLSFEFIYSSILMWIIIILFMIIIFKTNENVRKKIRLFISNVIVIIFLVNFILATNYAIQTIRRYESADVVVEYVVDDKENKPNIYWIHCDGMINFNDVEQYFKFDNANFKNYLNNNNYYLNEKASLFSAGHTMQALVSLFNPKYYDEVFKQYLDDLENNKKGKIISYDKLTEKRLNNELFNALAKKNYKFATISDFNQYASFYSDYMFDYYSFQKSKEKDLDYFNSSDNTQKDIELYTSYAHLKTLADTTFFHYFTDDFNFLDHQEINYTNFDTSEYKAIDNSEYWKAKALLKSLDLIYQKNEDSLFTFIDFSINHTPWLYDKTGKIINSNLEGFNPKNFLANYEHSTYLLIDILEYIKKNDNDSIIILQGDHGIHTVSIQAIASYVNLEPKEVYGIINSTISAIYIPEKYKNGDEIYLDNPHNISRYLVNNIVGQNYEYLE